MRRAHALAGLVVALAAVSSACAKLTDDRVRDAWGGSSRTPGSQGPGRTGDRGDLTGDTEAVPVFVGWERVDEILDGALAEASLGTDDEVMARLAERWCQVQPEPRPTPDGPALVCKPDPPIEVEGQVFSLELGGEGVIGLVTDGLSRDESSRLVDLARRRTERWCTRPWTDVSPRPSESTPPNRAAELHTCPVEGSALLVVGRFVSNIEADNWQVSLAVIDAS